MKRKYILSFIMSNYLIYGGGTNLAALNYQNMYNSAGISYISLAPYLFRGNKYKFTQEKWCVIVDDREIAVCNTNQVLIYLEKLKGNGWDLLQIHVHHWKNTDLCGFMNIVRTTTAEILMFIHDYSTICKNFTLLDENNQYCGNGGIFKEKCVKCKYYYDAAEKVKQYMSVWNELHDRIIFVFPSEIAKEVWLSAYSHYNIKSKVVPHQKFVGVYKKNKNSDLKHIRIAYLGSRENYKGWNIYYQLFKLNSSNDIFEWYYFGTDDIKGIGIKGVYVDNKMDPKAMIKALRAHEIDTVLLWSLCKETYSYTYHECLASNVYVITNKESGNIASQVNKYNNGEVLYSTEELFHTFKEGIFKNNLITFKNSSFFGAMELLVNDELVVREIDNMKIPYRVAKIYSCGIINRFLFAWDIFVKYIKNKLNNYTKY